MATKKVTGTMDVQNNKVTKYGDMTDEQKKALDADLKKVDKKPKADRNRKGIKEANEKAIREGKANHGENHKDLADAVTGKTKTEIDYDNKHLYIKVTSLATGKVYKYILRGVFFSDLKCFGVTNASKVYGSCLWLAQMGTTIYHKVGKKLDTKESASSLIADQFREATETISENIASCLWSHNNYETLQKAIASCIAHGSRDWRELPHEKMSNYVSAIYRQAQSVCDKAKNLAQKMSNATSSVA